MQGFVRQEQVRLDDFLANRFGKVYDKSMREFSWKDEGIV
jgi:hypothetical protein